MRLQQNHHTLFLNTVFLIPSCHRTQHLDLAPVAGGSLSQKAASGPGGGGAMTGCELTEDRGCWGTGTCLCR
ncbi:hypothetical protein CesoFtcFv8_000713 [Champsocephalus esox]|uniref:Uncharacterized protein n=1 Tax=Champsocephalus esox TaxID=159716 RepID=A0AAN8HK01_9TELE|nr:hypothetical protein CesoFtcFv8_000713 [Champsocephalus esox]